MILETRAVGFMKDLISIRWFSTLSSIILLSFSVKSKSFLGLYGTFFFKCLNIESLIPRKTLLAKAVSSPAERASLI